MNETLLKLGLEVLFGLIMIPYLTWVTMSIFTLKQENAVIRAEMGLMKEIRDWMQDQRRTPN